MSTETVSAEVAEAVAENVEDAVEEIVEMVEIVRNNPVALAVVGVLGLAAGAAGGYFVARKLLRSHYEEIVEEQVLVAKEFYAGLHKVNVDGSPLTPQQILETSDPEALAALREYQGAAVADAETPAATEEELLERRVTEARHHEISHPVEVVEEKQESRNVFVDPNFDYDEELKHRTKDKPYIITHDEYFGAEYEEFDTIQLTYFEKDDTLVDENDKPVDDLDGTIGEDHLARFGHGSKDKNIVYIRNEKLQCEYEITLSDQSYLESLGLGPERDELRHNDQRDRRRAFLNHES